MKTPCKFQDRKIGSCATVQMSLECVWTPRSVKKLQRWRRPDARSSFPNLYTELDFSSRHCLWSFCKSSGRRGNTTGRCPAFQNIPDFRSKAEMSYSEDHSDIYLLWKDLRYFGRRSQKTVRTRLTSIRTLDSQNLNLNRFRISVSL